jgi:hypothetical protein
VLASDAIAEEQKIEVDMVGLDDEVSLTLLQARALIVIMQH